MADLAVWQRTIVDEKGDVIPGAEVEVRSYPGGSLITLYEGPDGAQVKGNPFSTGSDGFARFWADSQRAEIVAHGAGSTIRWIVDLINADEVIGDAVSEATAAAAVAVGEAKAEADRAEAARDAAQLSAGVYPSTAAGLAATSDGDYFSVPVSSGSNSLILYRNVSGSAQEATRFPSIVGVQELVDEGYTKRGRPPASTDISTLRDPGIYYLLPGNGYHPLPADADPAAAYWLMVSNPGDASGQGLDRFTYHELVDLLPTAGKRPRWTRRVDNNSPDSTTGPHAWVREDVLNIAAGDLTDQWRNRGTLGAGDDLDNVVADGLYIVVDAVANAPPDAMVGALLNVRVFGSYISQTYHSLTDPMDGWSRTIRPGVSQNDWMPLRPPPADLPLADKTIVAFGDSITEASGRLYKWPAMFGARTGATVVNGGFGGCRMAAHTGTSVSHLYDPMSMYRLSERVANQDWQVLIDAAQALYEEEGDDNRAQAAALAGADWASVDYAIIFYGTNDFSAAVPIGDATDADGTTFKGAINYTVENILSAYPRIKILFVTPLWRARVGGVDDADSNVTPNSAGVYLREYAEAIKERAAAYQMPVIDLHANSGINILNWQTFMPDGLHPYPEEGMRRVADTIAGGFLAATW